MPAALTMSLCLVATGAAAQQAPPALPGSIDTGRAINPNQLLQAPQAPSAAVKFSFPAQNKGSTAKSGSGLKFVLQRITVTGASLVGPDFYDPLIKELVGRKIGLAEVVALADAIQAQYLALGYPLTRAYVPPQEIAGGTIRIAVLEGHVGKVEVEGVEGATAERLKAVVSPILESNPTDLATIERALLLAGDRPAMAVTGVLQPGTEPGVADLVLTASERPLVASMGVSNRGTDYVGPWTSYADVAFGNQFGLGEQIGITLSGTPSSPGQRSVTMRYLQPIGSDGVVSTITGSFSKGKPAESLSEYDVRTESYSIGQNITYPLVRSRRENVLIDFGWTVQSSVVNLLSARYTKDDWRTVSLKGTYAEAGFLKGGTVITGGIVQGVPVFGTNSASAGEGSRTGARSFFSKFVVDSQRVQNLPYGFSLAVNVAAQYSALPLFSAEEFSLGGARFGRGYNSGDLTGTNGLGLSGELRYPIVLDDDRVASLVAYSFYDWGRVWRSTVTDPHLASAGAGFRTVLTSGETINIEVAQRLRALDVTGAEHVGTRVLVEVATTF